MLPGVPKTSVTKPQEYQLGVINYTSSVPVGPSKGKPACNFLEDLIKWFPGADVALPKSGGWGGSEGQPSCQTTLGQGLAWGQAEQQSPQTSALCPLSDQEELSQSWGWWGGSLVLGQDQ